MDHGSTAGPGSPEAPEHLLYASAHIKAVDLLQIRRH